MKKGIKSIICIVLTVVLIIGFAPSFGASEVEAADSAIPIKASDLNAAKDNIGGTGWEYILSYTNGLPALFLYSGTFTLELDEDLELYEIDGYWSGSTVLDIEGSKNLTIKSWMGCNKDLTISGSGSVSAKTINADNNLVISGKKITDNYYLEGNSVTIKDGANVSGGSINSYSTVTITNSTVSLTGEDRYSDLLYSEEGITLNNCSITKPSGGKVMKVSREYSGTVQNVSEDEYTYWTIRANADTPAETILIEPSLTPEDAKEETPAADNSSGESSGGKKNYKNEWVDGQWYDANGKTDYKYKGGWKKNSTGWWYEDENGWFPTARWQKIDGDWYYFDDIGYMASNEYAGNWAAYSEGYWWVGEDGAWDGSEPGVWRLSGTKWWFKDSTGWYAKGKWYKIGGTWYEFDADGWWIEK